MDVHLPGTDNWLTSFYERALSIDIPPAGMHESAFIQFPKGDGDAKKF